MTTKTKRTIVLLFQFIYIILLTISLYLMCIVKGGDIYVVIPIILLYIGSKINSYMFKVYLRKLNKKVFGRE